jgi:hypothetical protein
MSWLICHKKNIILECIWVIFFQSSDTWMDINNTLLDSSFREEFVTVNFFIMAQMCTKILWIYYCKKIIESHLYEIIINSFIKN